MDEQQKALREAEERGRAKQAVDSRLNGHDTEIRALHTGLSEVKTEVHGLGGKIDSLDDKWDTRETETRAVADVAKQAAEKQAQVAQRTESAIKNQVTRWELRLGAVTVVVLLLGLIVTVLAHFA